MLVPQRKYLLMIAAFFLLSASAGAQVVGISAILQSTTSNQLDGYSETDIQDANTAYYYSAGVDGYAFEGNNEVDEQTAPTGSSDTFSCPSAPINQGNTYTIYSDHYLIAYYVVSGVGYYNPEYYDPVTAFAPGDGGGDPTGTGYAPGGGAEYLQEQIIYLGYTYVQLSTAVPNVTSISPSSGVQGDSGNISVQGQHLRDDLGVLSAAFADNDITVSVSSGDANQATLSYSISASAAIGIHKLTLSNTWGPGEPVNFTVGYPAATITGISPNTWIAGQSYTGVQISGTNFGPTPTVVLSDPTIAAGPPYNTSTNGSTSTTYIDLTVPATAPPEAVVVTLTPGTGGSSASSTVMVVGGTAQNSCPAASDSHSGFAGIVPTGSGIGGSGAMTASFSGGSFNGSSMTAAYGPYSTPDSIAASLAALITKRYSSSGLSAQAFGSYIVYKSTATLGTPSLAASGSSFQQNVSPAVCPPVNTQFVLSVLTDSVVWVSTRGDVSNGRVVEYSLEYWPTVKNAMGRPTTFTNAIITEHLTKSMSYGVTSNGVISGEFTDVLGNIGGANSGTYIADRYFTVTANGQNLGHILSYDAAGMHPTDHIVIHLPTGPSILNGYTNNDGSPKDISLP